MNTLLNTQSFLICLVAAIALFTRSAYASPRQEPQSNFEAIDDYIKTEMKRLGIPGMALGIVHGNDIVHLQGYGVADSSGRAITPQTPFQIGSVTKSFTALAVMQLAEAGKLNLDAPVQTYLPWFKLADREASAQITVRHLLNQTSGISEKDGNRFWNSDANAEEAVRQMNTIQLSHPIGTKFEYCNLNFVVLGVIVEKVSGQSYDDYVTEHILTTLDMRNSYTSHTDSEAHGSSDGHYYILGRAYRRDGAFPPAYQASGYLASSAEDMTHYIIAQLNEGKYERAFILSPQGIAELHNPAAPMKMPGYYYAMGWAVSPFDGNNSISHSGDHGNFHSAVIMQPERRHGIVLLANASGFEQVLQVDGIARGVMNLLNDKEPAPVTLPFMFRFLYWSVLLTPLLQGAWIISTLINGQPVGWQAIIAIILNLAAAIFFLFGVPGMVPFPLSSLRVFYPELGYALISGGTLGFGWSIIYALLNLKK